MRVEQMLDKLPDDKAFDSALHKTGASLLRCLPSHELPLADATSALIFEPFRHVAEVLHLVSLPSFDS